MDDLEQRVRALEDRFALSELRSKYCWSTTRGNREDVISLFTPDAVFENYRAPGGSPAVARGHDELRTYLSKMAPGRRLPMVMNEVVHVDGDWAEGTCAMFSNGEDAFCGHYIDEFARSRGGWLFSKRSFYPYWPVFAPETERRAP